MRISNQFARRLCYYVLQFVPCPEQGPKEVLLANTRKDYGDLTYLMLLSSSELMTLYPGTILPLRFKVA